MMIHPLLQELQYLDMEVSSKQEILAEYQDSIDKVTRSLSPTAGCGSGSEKHNMEITMIRVADLQKEIQEDLAKLLEKRNNVIRIFNKFTNPRIRIIFMKRYIQGKQFNQIARELKLCETVVYELHRKGMRQFEEFVFQEENND